MLTPQRSEWTWVSMSVSGETKRISSVVAISSAIPFKTLFVVTEGDAGESCVVRRRERWGVVLLPVKR
ncbi:hypothetical protein ACYCAX_15945 [Pseudomonas sp. MT3]|jgi:hypothetical protein|nr:hypothetical protein [Pseudomonas aeruginosa]